VTGSSLAERLSSIFFTATSSALLRMPCSTASQLMADSVSAPVIPPQVEGRQK
jgi:hypothetical protein